jgi:hypothetical protein
MNKIRESQSLLVSSIMLLLIITSILPQDKLLPQAVCAPDTFGNTTTGGAGDWIEDRIRGTVFTSPGSLSDRFIAERKYSFPASLVLLTANTYLNGSPSISQIPNQFWKVA